MTSSTLFDGSRMYAAAADAINDCYPNALHVISHTLGMAIELALKAHLVHKGLTEKELRRLGHDLEALLRECEARGLTHTGGRHFRLSVLGANFEERVFAYPSERHLVVIMPVRLREITHEIICEVFEAIAGSAQLKALAGAPGLAIQSRYPDDLNPSDWDLPPPTQ